jgi:hypothetical protein
MRDLIFKRKHFVAVLTRCTVSCMANCNERNKWVRVKEHQIHVCAVLWQLTLHTSDYMDSSFKLLMHEFNKRLI